MAKIYNKQKVFYASQLIGVQNAQETNKFTMLTLVILRIEKVNE